MRETKPRRPDRRLLALAATALLLLVPAAASATASTGSGTDAGATAAVQSVLDRVVGPGRATVVVDDTIRTSTSRTTTVRWGSGVPTSIAAERVVAGGTTSTSVAQQDAVGGSTTTVVTPPGALVRRSVSVAVDRSSLRTVGTGALRRLVAAAAGLVPGRGDRVSVIAVRFAATRTAPAPSFGPAAILLPLAVPAIWAAGALLALTVLVRALRVGRSRRLRRAA